MQYVPEEGVYTYFRYDDKQTVMIVMNTDNIEKKLDLQRFKERVKNFASGMDVINKKIIYNMQESLKVQGNSILILELQ